MTERTATPSTARQLMWAAYSIMLVFGLSVGLPGPAAPSLQRAYGLSYSGAALHITLFSVGSAIGSMLDGRLRSRFSRGTVLRCALVGVGLGAIISGLAPTAAASLVGVTIMGTGGTIAVNIAHGVLGSEHGDRRGTALVNAHLFAAVGLASAAVVVAGARAIGQWRLAFIAPVAIVALLLVTRQAAALPEQVAAVPAGAGARSATPLAVRIGGGVLALAVTVEWAATFWAATFLRDPVGLRPAFADAVTIGVLAALVVGRWTLGRLSRNRDSAVLLRAALLITVGASVPYLVGPRLPDPYGPAVSIAALVVLCLTVTALFPLALAVTLGATDGSAASQQRASATAMAMGATGAVVTPYLLGAVADATTLTMALTALPVGALLALGGVELTHRAAAQSVP